MSTIPANARPVGDTVLDLDAQISRNDEVLKGLDLPAPPLHEALAAVARSVTAVGKSGKAAGEMGGYKFRKIDDVMNAVHPAMAENGVLIWYDLLDEPRHEPWGGKMHRLVLHIRFTFTGPAGDERQIETWGEALDNGDKGIGKAVSYALKDILCRLLTLPFDEPDNDLEANTAPLRDDYEEPPPPPPPPAPDLIPEHVRSMIKARIARMTDEQRETLGERWKRLSEQKALRPLAGLRNSELPAAFDLLKNVDGFEQDGTRAVEIVTPDIGVIEPPCDFDAVAISAQFGCPHDECPAPAQCTQFGGCSEKPMAPSDDDG